MKKEIPSRTFPRHSEARSLGLNRNITRRDFVGATLIGWGAILLGAPAPLEVIRERHGRIAFDHSELSGRQSWGRAAQESRRAFKQVLEVLV